MLDNVNGVPLIGDRESQMKQAIAAQLADMSREIYCQIVSANFVADCGVPMDTGRLHEIAHEAHDAAKAFYEGLGVLKFKPTDAG